MKQAIFILSILIIIIGCSSPESKNKSKKIKTHQTESLTQVSVDKAMVENQSVQSDTVTKFKFDFYTRGNEKIKYYYKEVEENDRTIRVNKDFIDSDSIVINGVLPFFSTIPLMEEKLGEPDSVVAFEYEMDDSKGFVYFYPNFKIRVYDTENFVRLESMKFTNNKTFLLYKGIVFNSNTDIAEFQNLFPLSYLNAIKDTNYNNENVTRYWLDFSTSGKFYSDDKFTLTFSNGKLISLSYWQPM